MSRINSSDIRWAAVFAALCVICSGIWLYRGHSASGRMAEISVDGETVKKIELDKVTEPYEFDIDTQWGRNTVRVEQGRIAVTDADCPDRICVDTGYIDNSAVPIVCLPHRLTITVTGDADFDAVAGNI